MPGCFASTSIESLRTRCSLSIQISSGISASPACRALCSSSPRRLALRRRDELLELRDVDRRLVVARLDPADLVRPDRFDRAGDGLEHPEDVSRVGPGERAELLQLTRVGARERLGVALEPGLAGGQLLREQREVDVRDVAVLDHLELPVLGAAEVARDRATEARAEALHQLRDRREVDRHLRSLRRRVEAALGAERELLVDPRHGHVGLEREARRIGGGARLRDVREARELGRHRSGRAAAARGEDGGQDDESSYEGMGASHDHAGSMHRPWAVRPSSAKRGIGETRRRRPFLQGCSGRARPAPART